VIGHNPADHHGTPTPPKTVLLLQARHPVGKLALTAQPTAPASWARWPQHHPSADYAMPMEPGMMPFDLRPMTSGPVRPTSQYFTSPALTIAPMPTMVAPSYPSVSYGGFQPFTPAPVLDSPFKHESDHRRQYAEQPQLRTDLEESMLNLKSEPVRSPHDFRDNRSPFQRSRSPSVKSEDRSSQRSLSSDRTFTTSMTSVSNVEFNTNVDTLMKAIQAKPDTEVVSRREELVAPGTQVKLERVCNERLILHQEL
jgi:hypothetical protein